MNNTKSTLQTTAKLTSMDYKTPTLSSEPHSRTSSKNDFLKNLEGNIDNTAPINNSKRIKISSINRSDTVDLSSTN